MVEVGSEGKEHNKIMDLSLSIVEYIQRSYDEGFVGQVRGVVSIYVFCEQRVPAKKAV